MNQTAEASTLDVNNAARPKLQGWFQLTVLVALIALLYYRILAALASDWWTDPNYSHGFIVPIFCAWVIWRERKRIAAAPVRPSWFGLVVVIGSLCLLVLGVLGAELYLSRTS